MRIGFVSTRFAGTDGVSLESGKWAEVLEEMGHEAFWFSGRSDRPPEVSMCVPEAFFGHAENEWINERIWSGHKRDPLVTERIREVSAYLASMLRRFVERFQIDVLVPENVLTIPVHVPLGVALTEFLAETGMPAVAHHHDFYWERVRFSSNAVPDFLDMSFPPRQPNVVHTVINQAAQEQLALRKGISSTLVPNVFNFEESREASDPWAADVREEIGLAPDDFFILQPTRIVPRKGIEHAIKLVAMLDDPRCKLVISHDSGDEGYEYQQMLEHLAEDDGVDLRIIADRVSERRQRDSQDRKMYTLWDIYPHADLVTYPSVYEGFGNALLEAFYFRKPVVINRYSIYVQDIEPKGFQMVEMDGYVTRETVREVRRLLFDEGLRGEMVDTNYELASRFYGYGALRKALEGALAQTGCTAPEEVDP
ncbi:MAG: glycosyltransferase family 4 protein [Akkermansiaceae bacterium]|nr:glycosyltransferase family 4 protein [Akkermansiaceae bacterium]